MSVVCGLSLIPDTLSITQLNTRSKIDANVSECFFLRICELINLACGEPQNCTRIEVQYLLDWEELNLKLDQVIKLAKLGDAIASHLKLSITD